MDVRVPLGLELLGEQRREVGERLAGVREKLALAKRDALVMHPGPMNRGVEIDTEIADDIDRSVIREQVEMGVAVRMACLHALLLPIANRPAADRAAALLEKVRSGAP